MKHKLLGRTGVKVSELCLGTMSFGGDADETTPGLHPVSAAVAWVGAHPAITAPIVGARNLEQLKDSLNADAPVEHAQLLRRRPGSFPRGRPVFPG